MLFQRLSALLIASLFVSLLWLPKGHAFDHKQITIITANASKDIRVVQSKTPAQWNQGPALLNNLSQGTGVFLWFPSERYYSFSTRGISSPIDVLLMNSSGQVIGTYENLKKNELFALPEPVRAILFMKEDFIDNHEIKKGNLVLTKEFPQKSKTPDYPDIKSRDEVLKKLVENAQINPTSPFAQYELARFYAAMGRHADAVTCYEKMIAIKKDVKGLVGLGVSFAALGKNTKALGVFKDAISLSPSKIEAYSKAALLLRRMGKNEEAAEVLRSALKYFPGFIEARIEMARLYLARGDLAAAQTVLKEYNARTDEDEAQLQRVLGDVFLRKNEKHEAAKAYAKYLNVFSNAPHSAELRSFILRHGREVSEMEGEE